MSMPEVIYGKTESSRLKTTRYGSMQLGAVLLILDFTGSFSARFYNAQIGPLGISYGLAGGVEAGLAELTSKQLGRHHIFYRENGRALAVNWGSSR